MDLNYQKPAMESFIFLVHQDNTEQIARREFFKIGETDTLGKSIEMEITTYRSFNAELFGYRYQQWVKVFFIDKENTVTHILFKTESIANFLELMRKLTAIKKSIGTQIVTAKTTKRSNDSGAYYAIEFESKDNESERIKQLSDFVNSNINGIYSARLADTFNKPEETKKLPSNKASTKAIQPSQEGEHF